MSYRVCSKPGCPTLHERAGLCPVHSRERDRARGTKAERGYGPVFQRTRRMWVQRIALGGVECVRCGKPITSADPFDLDHDDNDRSIIRGPACPSCNRSAGGRLSHRR
jgi:hypothetical protein